MPVVIWCDSAYNMCVIYGAYTTNADVIAKKTFLSSFVCGGYAPPL